MKNLNTAPTARELYGYLYDTDFDFKSIMPGWSYYDETDRKFLKSNGIMQTAAGELEYVTDWNVFDEGEEEIHIVFKIGDRFYEAVINNDSWGSGDSGWELLNVYAVVPREVTETRYVRI